MAQTPLFSFYRGDDYAFKVTITDSLSNPVDITGWDLTFTMKRNPNKDDTTAALKVSNLNISGVDAVNGNSTLLLPHAQTSTLKPGNYYFDVQAVKDAMVTTIVSGFVEVLSDVTWEI